MKNGFLSVIPKAIVSALDNDELEYFLCGECTINLEEWKNNTEYVGEYYSNHCIILWFWEILSIMTQENLSKFLYFCTGSNRVPPEGFK